LNLTRDILVSSLSFHKILLVPLRGGGYLAYQRFGPNAAGGGDSGAGGFGGAGGGFGGFFERMGDVFKGGVGGWRRRYDPSFDDEFSQAEFS
jgi:hypothetical protein